MAYSFVIGDTLVHPEEYLDKMHSGELGRFRTSLNRRSNALAKDAIPRPRKPAELAFSNGIITADDVISARKDQAPDFQAVGIGKPLSIEIASIYTGDAPGTALGQPPSLLVASAVKSLVTFDVAPRAINQLIGKIEDFTCYVPSALTEGCPVVYYTPALADETLLCSFELVAETFRKTTVEMISKLLASAGGLPVFAPASLYLMAGSALVKIAGDLGKLVLQKQPFLRDDLNLQFATPGIHPSIAHATVIYNQKDEAELTAYKLGRVGLPGRERQVLIHPQTGEEYRGAAPYMVALIDGRSRPDLASFTPHLATAAVLSRFYKASEDTEARLDTIFTDAMGLYNDYTFRQKAEGLKAQIAALNPEMENYAREKSRLEKLMNACKDNVRNEALKK